MKPSVYRITTIFLILMALTSCSTVVSKVSSYSKIGEPYSGVKFNWDAGRCLGMALFIIFPPTLVVTVPIGLADLALSAIADTLLYPIDKMFETTDKPESVPVRCIG